MDVCEASPEPPMKVVEWRREDFLSLGGLALVAALFSAGGRRENDGKIAS